MVAVRTLMRISPILLLFSTLVLAAPSLIDVEGAEVTQAEVNDLQTYFEEVNIGLLNALDDANGLADVDIAAGVQRLNHKPFRIKIVADSNAEKTVTVRIFLAPKQDWYEREASTLCEAVAAKPALKSSQDNLIRQADPALKTFTTKLARLAKISPASLAPEIAKNPAPMAKCFPQTADTIAKSSS